jgi:hypothetical protein
LLSSGTLLILTVVGPGGVLVVFVAGVEAALQDADEPVAGLAQCGVVADATWARTVAA